MEKSEQQESAMVLFKYGHYWDVPRTLIFWYRRQLFFLSNNFDEELDDYEPDYSIYQLPSWVAKPIVESSSWQVLDEKIGAKFLGTIPVKSVTFDRTHRSTLDPSFIDAYLQKDSAPAKPGTS
ncbi:MAG TPA: hypothetical protein VFR24_04185 [Candidatus Angelobacter sp.]|nr:hypothetical protein [Candidatus Angelobacter sp.]